MDQELLKLRLEKDGEELMYLLEIKKIIKQ